MKNSNILIDYFNFRTNANRIYGRSLLNPSQTVPYYPQTPPAGSDAPEFYYRLAPDTLFFVFYYMEVIEILEISNSVSFFSRELVHNI
jgi:CCR4-NOT transcriptional regulation complex NOT5 subunit